MLFNIIYICNDLKKKNKKQIREGLAISTSNWKPMLSHVNILKFWSQAHGVCILISVLFPVWSILKLNLKDS